MVRDTALNICPEYPPQDIERLPHYEGGITTPEENKAVFENLWNQGQALLDGSMSLYPSYMRLTTVSSDKTVIGTFVQPRSYPDCGFTLKLTGQANSIVRSLYVETVRIIEENDERSYIRRRINLYGDGAASSELLRLGMVGSRRFANENSQYELHDQLTTDDLRDLDDLYIDIKMQHEKHADESALRKNSKLSLLRNIGRRALQFRQNRKN